MDMLDDAIDDKQLDGLILHSDRSWHYQHSEYQDKLEKNNIEQSMSRRGNCIDNAMIEGFFGTMKKEMFFGKEHEFESIEQLIECIDNYVDKYNNKRIKEGLGFMSPVQYKLSKK